MHRRVKMEIVAGKYRQSSATAKGGAFTQNYSAMPNATTDAVASLKALTDGGVQLGLVPAYEHSAPYPLGYDVYINDAPILDVLAAGAIPA
jgi:hypothetical protein